MMKGLYGGGFSEKEKFYEVVRPVLSCGIFGIKKIVGCSMISLALLTLFGLLCSIRPLGGV